MSCEDCRVSREETMHEFLQRDVEYVIRFEEITWGCMLLGATLIIHGVGLFCTARVTVKLMSRPRRLGPGFGMAVVVLIALMIVVFHLIEVAMWAGFFTWKGAQPNIFSAFYNALVNYTTLGAGYLPLRWRLLEGMLGMAGLLSFAFTTSALMAVTHELVRPALIGQQQQTET